MYRPITMYQIVCDRCGEVFGGTDTCSALFSNKEVDIGDYSDWEMIDGKGWVCGYFYEENGNTYIIENRQKESKLNRNLTYQVDPSTVCQFTGLKDSEGKEIWESDIVHDSYDLLCIDNLYEVVYIEEEGTFAFKSLDKVDNYEPFVNLFEVYVVGNKFDKE